MIRRREELTATIKSRRRGKSFASDQSAAAAGSPVGRIAVGEDKTKEIDHWCKQSNVTASSPLDVTASTTSMSINYFDTSLNSGEKEINAQMTSPEDWDPLFSGNAGDEFAALESPAVKVSFDDDEVGALESPVCVNDMNSFTRKQLDKTKTSQSSSVKRFSVKDVMLRSLREENERLKNEIKEASEESGTLDAAEALVDESYRGSITDECTLEEGTLETSFYEDTVDTGIVDEGTLETDCYTIDEGASYNSRSHGDWDDVTLESDLASDTLGSAYASSPRKRKNTRNVKHAGPSSRTLRQALRRQSKSGAVTSTCPLVFEEIMGTYQDASDAFNQVLTAFFVSLDDVDKVSDVISGVEMALCESHTDKFAPRSKWA